MFKKICGVLSTIILIILAVLAALMLLPRAFGFQTMAVLTGSMEPNYHVGSLIYVKDISFDNLQVGDVVTYKIAEDTVVTHRIVEINSEDKTVITKGDANQDNDGNPVSENQIVGKAHYCIPALGLIAIYSKTPIGIGVVCGILIVILLLNFLPEIFEKEDKKEENAPVETTEEK